MNRKAAGTVTSRLPKLEFRPLTAERWKDLETLFGPRGACAGCWCMYWKLTRAEFARGQGEGNRRALRREVMRGGVPGILAYARGIPVAWCAVEPRSAYARLARSRVLAALDEQPVWSVPCFFVARSHRRQGLTVRLLRAAVKYVRRRGGRIVEGYPVIPKPYHAGSTAFAWTGFASAFEAAGFRDCAARSRPIMRRRA